MVNSMTQSLNALLEQATQRLILILSVMEILSTGLAEKMYLLHSVKLTNCLRYKCFLDSRRAESRNSNLCSLQRLYSRSWAPKTEL